MNLYQKMYYIMYQKMYYIMIQASEDAIAAINRGDPLCAERILIDAEQKAEECFLNADEKAAQ